MESDAGSKLTLSRLTLSFGGSAGSGSDGRVAALELGDTASLSNVTIFRSFATAIRGTGKNAAYDLSDVYVQEVYEAAYTPAALAAEAGTWTIVKFAMREILDGYALIDVSRGASATLSGCLYWAYTLPPLKTGGGAFQDDSDDTCADGDVGNASFYFSDKDETPVAFCDLPAGWLENKANLARHTIELIGDCLGAGGTTYVPRNAHLILSSPPDQRFEIRSLDNTPIFAVAGSLTLRNVDLVMKRGSSFEWGRGVYAIEGYRARKIVLEDVEILHSASLATETPGGIQLIGVADASLTRVTIIDSRLPADATQGSALNLIGANKVTITDSTFSTNIGGQGAIAAVGSEPEDLRTVVHMCGTIAFDSNNPMDIADPNKVIGGCPPVETIVPWIHPTTPPRTCRLLPPSIRLSKLTDNTQCNWGRGVHIGFPEIAARALDAVDIWSWILPNTQVCFVDRIGSITFLDAAYAPRAISQLPSFVIDGDTCARIDRAGTLVLMPEAAPTTCSLTTRDYTRVRAAPSPYSGILGHFAPGVATWAVQQIGEWYQTSLLGWIGFVHISAVATSGFCG